VDPVEAQLARILPELATESLRDALEDQRRRRDIAGRALEAVEESRAALEAAVGEGRVTDAGELATRANLVAMVLDMAPWHSRFDLRGGCVRAGPPAAQ
jgi:hypothetical protein